MLRSGYLSLGRWWNIPIGMHWTTPLIALFFSRFEFRPAYWLAVMLLIIVHELGHAFLVRRYGLRVLQIQLSPIGGLCHYEGGASRRQNAVIAWGGVLAQGALLLVTIIASHVPGVMDDPYSVQAYAAWTSTNAILIAVNLLPIPPLDGHLAWSVPWRFLTELPGRRKREATRKKHAELARLRADLTRERLSPELQAQLDSIVRDIGEA